MLLVNKQYTRGLILNVVSVVLLVVVVVVVGYLLTKAKVKLTHIVGPTMCADKS